MPIYRSPEDFAFLQRVDQAWRHGVTQEEIVSQEKARGVAVSSAGSLSRKLNALGFRFERKGGFRLVDVLLGRDFAEWVSAGELCEATSTAAPALVGAGTR